MSRPARCSGSSSSRPLAEASERVGWPRWGKRARRDTIVAGALQHLVQRPVGPVISRGCAGIWFARRHVMLTEGVDYLFFRSAYHSGGAGLKSSTVAVVATHRFLFLV